MKLKVFLFSLVFLLFLTISFGQVALASESLSESLIDLSTTIDYDNLLIVKSDGSTLNFDNIDDMKMYVNALKNPQEQEDSVQPYGFVETIEGTEFTEQKTDFLMPMSYGETIEGTEFKYYQFMGYSKFTSNWAKASSYTVLSSQSQTFSQKVSTKWGDATASYSYSSGVNTTIPADQNKWSKLAGYADLKIERVKTTQPSFGTIYTTRVTVLQSYLAVKYQ